MSLRWRPFILAAALSASAVAPRASAHGVLGHIHVTGWAIEDLPAGELRDFFADPEVLNAALYGAAYTDSGYPVTGKYQTAARYISETTHWEPFITGFVAWMRENDPPPWNTLESRKRAAFLMGCAAHGLQDEVFDSLFLDKVDYHDGAGQDIADPATDGFLALDSHLRLVPTPYIPRDAIRALYPDVDAATYDAAVDTATALVTGAYVNDTLGPAAAAEIGKYYEPTIPWTRQHYFDPDIVGGHRTEILPTMLYLQALWERLHGTLGDRTVVSSFPQLPRRLAGTDPADPGSWVAFTFGTGVLFDSVTATWTEADGTPVPFELRNTRWNATETRLVRLIPLQPLVPGRHYVAQITAATQVGGAMATPYTLDFQAQCASEGDPACPPIDPWIPPVDGSYVPPPTEVPDSSPGDTGPGEADAGAVETDVEDVAEPVDVEPVATADVGVDTGADSGSGAASAVEPGAIRASQSGGCAVDQGRSSLGWLSLGWSSLGFGSLVAVLRRRRALRGGVR